MNSAADREKYWVKHHPVCWTISKKPFHIMRLTQDATGSPVLLYPCSKNYPEGYGKSLSALFAEQIRPHHIRRFPKVRDKYFLCHSEKCQSTSIAAIYLLNGGVVNNRLATAYDTDTEWYKKHVLPHFIGDKDVSFTILEKVINGDFHNVREIVNPSAVRVFHAPLSHNAFNRVVVTRDDRPYFIMQACGKTIAVSDLAKNLGKLARATPQLKLLTAA